MGKPFTIEYAANAADDIRGLTAFDQRRLIETIERHLTHQPTQVSRSRIKRMTRPFWSQYRLRIDDFRAYYDVDEENRTVHVLRVLKKATGTTPGEAP